MSDLSTTEKLKLEKMLGMEGGYVLDFSNRTFQEFFLENAGIDIFLSKFDYSSGSKANRLRAFWNKEANITVGKLLIKLLEYWKVKRNLNTQLITFAEQSLFDECMVIANRLLQNAPNNRSQQQEIINPSTKEDQLKQLLQEFDELSISKEYQKRGYLLQDLLNHLLKINGISVTKSFQRNEGGEQIDGAFTYKGWHYLVECKWTEKLADISELDGLLGKVNRSGKQAMGVFLSIEGWSEHVPQLLKQNPNKCIILMEGYDLRCVLNNLISLENLLDAKLAKLNNDTEPYWSALQIMRNAEN